MKNPVRALEIGANVSSAFASRSPKAGLSSLPEVIIFYHTEKSLYLGKFFAFMPSKWNKKPRLYPSAPLENIDLEPRLEKLNVVISFNNSINNIEEMFTYLKDKNNKSKKKNKKYKTLTTILKSFDTFVIIATTSSSITVSLTGISLIVIPILGSIA